MNKDDQEFLESLVSEGISELENYLAQTNYKEVLDKQLIEDIKQLKKRIDDWLSEKDKKIDDWLIRRKIDRTIKKIQTKFGEK